MCALCVDKWRDAALRALAELFKTAIAATPDSALRHGGARLYLHPRALAVLRDQLAQESLVSWSDPTMGEEACFEWDGPASGDVAWYVRLPPLPLNVGAATCEGGGAAPVIVVPTSAA